MKSKLCRLFFLVSTLLLSMTVVLSAQEGRGGGRGEGRGGGRGGDGAQRGGGGGGGDRGGGAAGGQRGPQAPPPPFNPTASDTEKTKDGDLKITPVNHAGVMLQFNGANIYVDPVGNYAMLPKADWIFVTDVHGDHLSADTINQLKKDGTTIITPTSVSKMVQGATILDNGQNKTVKVGGKNVKVEAIPMYNMVRGPMPGQFYHEKGRGDGFILTFGGKRVYFAGDTECTPEMKKLKNIDIAFLPMNLPFTMTPAEAADCAKAFKPKAVYPYHYRDNDPMTDPQMFADALKGVKGIEVRMRNWY